MCLTIKLFWMKSALISFHNISVLQGALVREKSAEITLFQTRWYFGAVPFWARQSSFGLHRWAREIEPPTPPSPPARSVHRSTRDDRVVTQGVIMEGVRGPRSASGAASAASTFHNDAHSIRTENGVKPVAESFFLFFLPYRIVPPSTTFRPSLRSVPSGATCR
jgi:hypothetical protein